MKNILLQYLTLALIFSCSPDLEELNINIKDPASVPGEALFVSAQKSLVDQMASTNVNRNVFRLIMQQWTATTYTDEANYDIVTRTIPQNHWDALYKDVLRDLDEAHNAIAAAELLETDDPQAKTNKLAIVEILTVYTYSVLVDTFGDIPYTEALDIDNLLPKYDDALTIYKDLIIRLNTALEDLDANSMSFQNSDNLYGGDVSKWIKFGNSLKLKIGITLSEVSSEAATVTSLIEEAAPNVFSSNDDNAALTYLSATPNTNPIYVDLTLSGRQDFIPASTIIDKMQPRSYEFLTDSNEDGTIDERDTRTVVPGSVSFTDPRMKFYFEDNIDADTTALDQIVYLGGISGSSNPYPNFSHISEKISNDPSFEAVLMDYSEVEFLIAEAIERGYNVGGTAEDYYNEGITASIVYWGGTEIEAAEHLALPSIAYNTAIGDWKEKIGTQKWIALYNRGFSSWNSWKLLDQPVLPSPADPISNTPTRFTYPIVEQTLNGDSYNTAASAIGGDDVETKLFWDIN